MDSEEILDRLMKGNQRFLKKDDTKDLISNTKDEQHPFATVVCCSDSRVSPELIFDAKIGELFVVRTAGEVLDGSSVGSVEYGVCHLKTPVLAIIGHEKCGAVSAACSNVGPESYISFIVAKIKAKIHSLFGKLEGDDLVHEAVISNAKGVMDEILSTSPLIKEMYDNGSVKIILLDYDITTGKVKEVS